MIEHPEEQTNFVINYSLYRAGKHYLYGLGTEKNEEKAFEYLDNAANTGNVFGLYNEIEFPLAQVLADMTRTGVLVDKDGIEQFGTSGTATADVIPGIT